MNKSLEDVVLYFGGIPNLSKALGISRHSIYQWVKKCRIPFGRAFQIQAITHGDIKADDILKENIRYTKKSINKKP